MIVTCEACFTSFNLKDELVKPSGSKVRCSKCLKVFKVFPAAPEEISQPLPADLSDLPSDILFSPHVDQTPPLEASGEPQTAAPDLLSESPDFKDITEFDFTELDKFLQEDDKDDSKNGFANLQADPPPKSFQSSGEPSEPLDFSEISDILSESDLSDISQNPHETTDRQDKLIDDFDSPSLLETEPLDFLSDRIDETFEKVPSETLPDESVDDDVDLRTGVNPEIETESGPSGTQMQDFSLDDFEKSLEMDFTDISLVSAVEPQTIPDPNTNTAETEIKTDQPPEKTPFSEDTLIGINDIEELDLSDIERLLEKQETSGGALNQFTESFKRSDPIIVPLSTSSTEPHQPLEMEDQYLTFDELQIEKNDSKPATLLEVKESFQPTASEPSAPPIEPSRLYSPDTLEPLSGDENISNETDFDDELTETHPPAKKGIHPLILGALILTVIAAAGYGGYRLLNSMGIPIPFISQPTASKASDPGNLSIKLLDIDSRFVDNGKIGKLFVITGKVKNEYPMARGFIQIVGKLYTKDKTLAKTETVFCGNMISDMDLEHADSATLGQRLQNRSGDNQINQKVLPGTAIPFMIVFSGLPSNLEEFTTEVLASAAA